jgi:hypothetical protein
VKTGAAVSLIFVGLYLSSLHNYLLFHSLAEIFSLVIAFGIFMIVWNARKFADNSCLVFLGIAYHFVACFDLLHTLAYSGMGVFPGFGTNLPTQLWIASRYLESISLLLAPLFLERRLRPRLTFNIYGAVALILLAAIFYWQIFPVCFLPGTGLTPFKKISEYVICVILLLSLLLLYRKREHLDTAVLRWLSLSIIMTIFSEISFTFYFHAYDLVNLLGHLFKIISFMLIYKAIIQTGLVRPFSLLFRNLKRREMELEGALTEVKRLSGMLPICAYCKKVRDDTGYWQQVEVYIHEHADVDFSHSICPDCMAELYRKEGK